MIRALGDPWDMPCAVAYDTDKYYAEEARAVERAEADEQMQLDEWHMEAAERAAAIRNAAKESE